MKKDIPQIQFNPSMEEHDGFEIVPIEQIAENSESFDVNPEKPHQLNFYNLIFYTHGNSEHFVDFEWLPVQANNLIYLSKEQVNAFKFSKGLKGFCLLFTQEYFIKQFSHLPEDFIFRLFAPQLFSPVIAIPEESDFVEYINLLNKESSTPNSSNKETIIESLFIILLTKADQFKQVSMTKVEDSKIKLLQNFSLLLKERYTQSRSANYYAKELAITYKHLNVICKELLNKTAKTFINDYIILLAKRKLINSDIKASELAYLLGFEDSTNFSKYFKKLTGLTPKLFKNKFK